MLKGKQKRYLRSLAVNMQPIFQIGKGGMSENLTADISAALEARELVKVRVLQNCAEDAGSLGEALAAALGAELVQVIGRNILLYRPSVEQPQLELPR